MRVALDFAGRGAPFASTGGRWRHGLSNTPADRTLYDITDPSAPQVLVLTQGADAQFEDGPSARQYVLASPDTVVAPGIARHDPRQTTDALNAQVVYIAPARFAATLEPLVALRRQQGLRAAVVAAQDIYDAWSFGHVSPEAIRNYLRFARAKWNPGPAYVTLVGDGTVDPRGFAAPDAPGSNVIPPFMLAVNAAQGEIACDTCYAQLDGDHPLDDRQPDVAVGRLPVKTVEELRAVVAKLIAYETAPLTAGGAMWRARVAFAADNFRDAGGAQDAAGDFTLLAGPVISLLPEGVETRRLYFDPYLPNVALEPWREPDPAAAYARTLSLFEEGAAIINLYGHGQPSQFAHTGAFTNPVDGRPASYLLSRADPDRLTNGQRLPIVLEMACRMGSFHIVETGDSSGNNLNERLVLAPNGGAVAVWASSGLSEAYGYSYLQAGFYATLRQALGSAARLGDLTLAGQRNLLAHSDCCDWLSWTYVLLGDPAMSVRLTPAGDLPHRFVRYLPMVNGS
jgi:hypothetical protein